MSDEKLQQQVADLQNTMSDMVFERQAWGEALLAAKRALDIKVKQGTLAPEDLTVLQKIRYPEWVGDRRPDWKT